MIIVPLKAEHCMKLDQLEAVHEGFEMTPSMAVDLEAMGGFAAVEDDGRVIGVGGVAERWQGVGLAWAWLGRGWRRHARALTEIIRAQIELNDLRRIELAVRHDFDAGKRWAVRLGFDLETEVARGWGPDGKDYSIFVRVR